MGSSRLFALFALYRTALSSPLGRILPRESISYGITSSSLCPLSSSIAVNTNYIQASIIKQQEWNLCSYKAISQPATDTFSTTCSSYGMNSMLPFMTTGASTDSTATFIATYLTEYATLTSAACVTSTDCTGAMHTFSVGELGQMWSTWGRVDPSVPLPTPPPPAPVCTHPECQGGGYPASSATGSGKPLNPIISPSQPSDSPTPSLSVIEAPPIASSGYTLPDPSDHSTVTSIVNTYTPSALPPESSLGLSSTVSAIIPSSGSTLLETTASATLESSTPTTLETLESSVRSLPSEIAPSASTATSLSKSDSNTATQTVTVVPVISSTIETGTSGPDSSIVLTTLQLTTTASSGMTDVESLSSTAISGHPSSIATTTQLETSQTPTNTGEPGSTTPFSQVTEQSSIIQSLSLSESQSSTWGDATSSTQASDVPTISAPSDLPATTTSGLPPSTAEFSSSIPGTGTGVSSQLTESPTSAQTSEISPSMSGSTQYSSGQVTESSLSSFSTNTPLSDQSTSKKSPSLTSNVPSSGQNSLSLTSIQTSGSGTTDQSSGLPTSTQLSEPTTSEPPSISESSGQSSASSRLEQTTQFPISSTLSSVATSTQTSDLQSSAQNSDVSSAQGSSGFPSSLPSESTPAASATDISSIGKLPTMAPSSDPTGELTVVLTSILTLPNGDKTAFTIPSQPTIPIIVTLPGGSITTVTAPPSPVIVTLPGGTVTTILEPPELNSPWPIWSAPPEPTITGDPVRAVGDLASLLFALRNRRSLVWGARKAEYIKNVDETHDDLFAFLNKIPNPPKANPACSNSKKKRDVVERRHSLLRRGFLDSVINTFKSVAETVACALDVAKNLADKVKLPDPPSIDIDNLTDALEELGNKLQQQKEEDENGDDDNKTKDPTGSSDGSKSTTSSTSSSCSASIASSCRTSCVNGTTSSCTTVCATSTGCSVTNTATATTSTASGTATFPPFAIIEAYVDTYWVLGEKLSDEEQEKLFDEMESFLSEELTPTPTTSETTSETPAPEPTPTEQPVPSKPEYEDHCADTNVFRRFDWGRAEMDIGHFCQGGLELKVPATPIWNTYVHEDTEVKIQIAVQWSHFGQDGCNSPPGDLDNKLSEEDCRSNFMAALNRCNKENSLEQKFGNYPMVWNSPRGCVDFWLVGHDMEWDCAAIPDEPIECEGSRLGT